jgi:hypothetical protein
MMTPSPHCCQQTAADVRHSCRYISFISGLPLSVDRSRSQHASWYYCIPQDQLHTVSPVQQLLQQSQLKHPAPPAGPGRPARPTTNAVMQPPPATVDEATLAARRRTGDAAEALVAALLQSKYGDSFEVARHWVSSARVRLLPHTRAVGPADDAAGYDLEVVDREQWLVLGQGAAFVKCYVKVKVGCCWTVAAG